MDSRKKNGKIKIWITLCLTYLFELWTVEETKETVNFIILADHIASETNSERKQNRILNGQFSNSRLI